MDVRNRKVDDMFKEDVLEHVIVKEQIIKSATEAASMLLRIDDVIAASPKCLLDHLVVAEEWAVWVVHTVAAVMAVIWTWKSNFRIKGTAIVRNLTFDPSYFFFSTMSTSLIMSLRNCL